MIEGLALGRHLLDRAYARLEERQEELVDTALALGEGSASPDVRQRWTEIGDWLTLGHRMGAEKVLFLRNEPVFVFAELASDDEALLHDAYRRAWSMSGPFCLFLALPTELRVFALTVPPPRVRSSESLTALTILTRVEQVDALLRSGAEPDDPQGALGLMQASPVAARAAARLIRELGIIRRELMMPSVGLLRDQAHSLIGRSILIRYLEDRRVLTRAYFEGVAGTNAAWRNVLDAETTPPDLAPGRKERFYDRVLLDAKFTTALYRTLAKDFNGDLFSLGEDALDDLSPERLIVALHLLRRLLLGDADQNQPQLFVWAYDFEVVPITLISSIYEEFYHSAEGAIADSNEPRAPSDDNTHYTPWTLVHDVLCRVLTDDVLKTDPRVLDPACGSGIFLVEAFRRIVRFKSKQLGRRLNSVELREIMRNQIAGIEVESEAARVTAFSLHLALLDQQTPPDILESGRLPYIVHDKQRDDNQFGIIIVGNAFDLTSSERRELNDRLTEAPNFRGHSLLKKLLENPVTMDFELGAFDVVIGNPPWQEISLGPVAPKSIAHGRQAIRWANAFGLDVGDNSYSQLFIHRSLSFLKSNGRSGLLVSAKTLWNSRDSSKRFRSTFLERARLFEVFNYAHVRFVFFTGAVAPFAFLHFGRRDPERSVGMVVYWSARKTGALLRFKSMALARVDRRVIAQSDLLASDHLWKTYWWGSHHDAALVGRLAMEGTISLYLADREPRPGYGWQRGAKPPSANLAELEELSSRPLQPFGSLQREWFETSPRGVKRDPDPRIYYGQRLVVTRGVKEPYGPVVRLEDASFSFRHTILSVPLPNVSDRDAKVILGTAWSSLARYRLFMTSGNWGGWSDQVTKEDFLATPLRMLAVWGMSVNAHRFAVDRIVEAVDGLRSIGRAPPTRRRRAEITSLDEHRRAEQVDDLLQRLNLAVYDLFELSGPERDLVEDFWSYSHNLYWKGIDATALKPLLLGKLQHGRMEDLSDDAGVGGIKLYLASFLDFWNPKVGDDEEFAWRLGCSRDGDAIAVTFDLVTKDEPGPPYDLTEGEQEWQVALGNCSRGLGCQITPALLAERIIRVVTDRYFVIVKSSDRRQWSASAAREDAEAILLQAMRLQPAQVP